MNISRISLVDDEENIIFQQSDLFALSFPVMDDIRKKGKLCDVVLKVEDIQFPVHRIVLASSIPYFYAMFMNDMIESTQREITIHGIEVTAFEQLIDFAYTGRLKIDIDNVESLLVGSSFLQMNHVIDACANFLKKRFHPQIVIRVRKFANSIGCLPLVNACDKYIDNHFIEVSLSTEFINLTSEELIDIIKRDELDIPSEESVFKAVINWINHSPNLRAPALPELLSRVRLPLLHPHYLADNVSTEQLIRSSHQCRDLVDEARDYHLLPERRFLVKGGRSIPRVGNVITGNIYAVGGLTMTGNSLSTVECYNPDDGVWKVVESMLTLRSRVGVSAVQRKLYAVGGYDGLQRLSSVEAYCPDEKKWSHVAPMTMRKSAVGACTIGEEIYVCGGYDGATSLNTLEIYNAVTNQWMEGPPMGNIRSACGAAAAGRCCWVLGGHDKLSVFDSIERFDPRESGWHKQKPMLAKRCRLGVAVLGGALVAAGGYNGVVILRSVEIFEPSMCKWRQLAPLSVRRSRLSLVATHGKLWAIGGHDGETNLNTVEMYDPAQDTWSLVNSMRVHKGGVGVGVVPVE